MVRCALSADNHLAEVFVDGVAVRWNGNSGTKASWVSTISFNVGASALQPGPHNDIVLQNTL